MITYLPRVCSLVQGYEMWRVSRYRYAGEEVSGVMGRARWRLILLEELVGWYRRKVTTYGQVLGRGVGLLV